MRSRFLLFIMAGLLVAGLILLFHQRFQSNDLYPRYSSQRADPQGLKILYEAFAGSGAVQTERSFRPLNLWKGSRTSLIVAGIPPNSWLYDETNLQNAERIARLGNRVVIALDHGVKFYPRSDIKDQPLAKLWNITIETVPAPKDQEDEFRPWPFYFSAGKEWRVTRSEAGRPVILERAFDSGSIVLMASSWSLTNEAMVDDRQAELLLDLAGSQPRMRFDESHLGMAESGTIMGLARRFHLQGFLAGLLVLAALFIWRNIAGFPPHRAPAAGTRLAAGRDSLTGLAIMLERHLPEKDLLASCLREREKTGEKRLSPALRQQTESIAQSAPGVTAGFASIQELIAPQRKSL